MGLFDAFSYKGKRALVVGGATGMGAATAELVQDAGAEVVVMDRAEVTLPGVKAISLDLSDKASIDAALAECGGPVDALFSCAGVADGTPGIERINFIGHRYMIDRLLADDLLPRGSAIGMISSAAGMGWENSLTELQEYLDITDFDAASKWAQDHLHADYMWSKKAINAYVSREAFGLLKKGIRINAIMPGRPTRRWPRPTRRCGSASAPTTAKRPASRRRSRSSRPTRSCSCAATRRRGSPASRSSPTLVTSVRA